MSIQFDEKNLALLLNKKIRLSVILIAVVFLFICFRLGYLQILKGSKYSALSTNNRIRITKTPDPRGLILSKQNQALVKNIPSFDLHLIPQDTPDIDTVLLNIAELLQIHFEDLKEVVKKNAGRPPFKPISLKKELSWNEMSLVLSKKLDLQGITVETVPKRLYCLGTFASHIFGFLGEIDHTELQDPEYSDYAMGDLLGKYGLEKWGEKYLRGKKGGLQTEVDVYGNRQNILAEIAPVPGCNLIVSIDPVLQTKAEELLQKKTGTVIAIHVSSGEIFAMASSPGFDSNLFARGIDYKDWKKLIDNPFHPLLNRALQSQQPPGSIFKIIVAIAALEEKIINPQVQFFCPGHYTLGARTFNCWKRGGHGWMNMRDAIVESCDTYFYNIALKVGMDNMVRYATMYGFGEKTGLELEGEKPGFVPTPQWKKEKYGIAWQKGETLNMSIGQGFLLATPIQLACFFCGIANNGKIPKPRLVLNVDCRDTKERYSPETLRICRISQQTHAFIRDALAGVVNDPKGTGARAKTDRIIVAGKTGTSQVASKKSIKSETDIPRHLRDHAWFVSMAPADKPEIVVCVLVEHGGSGGQVAAPIAKEMLSSYFSLNEIQTRAEKGSPLN